MKFEAAVPETLFDEPALDRSFALFRGVLGGSTLLMVALSWPLWVHDPDFPKIPFFRATPELPTWVSWLVLGSILATIGLATIGLRYRLMLRIGVVALGFAILQDQNRCQPWAYQFVLIGLAMAFLTRGRALRMGRWYVLGIYFYSGLSKLDASFCREMGPTFLSAALQPFGSEPGHWPDSSRTLACLGMPAFEIAVAWLLAFPSTRRIGLIGAVAQHATLIGILGPWGLGHSPIVLVWNFGLIIEDLILFGRATLPADLEPNSGWGRIATGIFWAAMILPAGERLGLCDAWPGHALYASHVERSDIFVHEGDLDRYPDDIRKRLGPAGVTPWRRLDITSWSRNLRGTPTYPSGRVGNALAEFLEVRYASLEPVRLVQWGRAGAWSGERERDESLGLGAIRRRGDRFLLNAHPTRPGSP